jgi:hypothetical protein
VDLAGLQTSARSRPILKDHNRSLIVGHTDSVAVQGSNLLVTGVISGAGPVAREIVESSRNGFPWQASLGALAERVEFVPKGHKAAANGREFEGPVHIARKATLGEISFVALDLVTRRAALQAEHGKIVVERVGRPRRFLRPRSLFVSWIPAMIRATAAFLFPAPLRVFARNLLQVACHLGKLSPRFLQEVPGTETDTKGARLNRMWRTSCPWLS